ncbi:hypothetical protein Cni_G18117 [Canna indica]|uniref:B box-type domain-containing protein n=1 Tax=Canna indica TaxID=4628 RepID=A0AAQ3KIT4_9LILI|nr:hypothetical protein Cni_G18117 [Canna indica]
MVGYAFHYKKKSGVNRDEEGEEEEEEGEEEEEEGEVIVPGTRRERRRKEASSSSASASVAGWVDMLLRSEFFGVCDQHREERRSEENIYCVDCGCRMCPHCLSRPGGAHSAHRLLQIRRYVYQDVVRVHDMHSLLDCSKVQPYTVNSAKVVLLKPRKQSKPLKSNPGGPACGICRRSISDPNRYCSISCMVSDVSTVVIPECSPLEPSVPHLTAEAEVVGPDSPPCCLSPPQPHDEGREEICRWIPKLPRRRRVHRRKAVPQRSPLL